MTIPKVFFVPILLQIEGEKKILHAISLLFFFCRVDL